MQFQSHATNQDLVSETRDLCDADSTSYPIAQVTRRINVGYEFLIGKIIGSDGTWEWDDTNYTTKPRGVGTLVEGQEAYSFSSEYLNIRQIEILDTGSPASFRKIKPIQDLDLGNQSPEEYFGLESDGSPKKGFPEYYDKEGDTITLYPAPTSTYCTLASGLRVWFQRTADLFTTTDTTQEPGLPSPYHILLAYYAAIPYCALYKKDRVAWLQKQWDDGVVDMLKFFGRRSKDERKVMTTRWINHR